MYWMRLTWIIILSHSDFPTVGDVIAADQKWRNYDNVVLKIYKVNKANSTFAGTYGIIRSSEETAEFPFRGEYDPKGITLGWVVSYWSASGCENDHAMGVWAGYLKLGNDRVPRWTFSTTRLIAHEENYNTTTGYDTFILESDDHIWDVASLLPWKKLFNTEWCS